MNICCDVGGEEGRLGDGSTTWYFWGVILRFGESNYGIGGFIYIVFMTCFLIRDQRWHNRMCVCYQKSMNQQQ